MVKTAGWAAVAPRARASRVSKIEKAILELKSSASIQNHVLPRRAAVYAFPGSVGPE